jgi:hypothetical protein
MFCSLMKHKIRSYVIGHFDCHRIKLVTLYILSANTYIFPSSQDISKNESTKVNVSGLNFVPNALIFVDHFLLIFWDGESK